MGLAFEVLVVNSADASFIYAELLTTYPRNRPGTIGITSCELARSMISEVEDEPHALSYD